MAADNVVASAAAGSFAADAEIAEEAEVIAAGRNGIIAIAAGECVVSFAPIERIIARAARDAVIAGIAIEDIAVPPPSMRSFPSSP